MSREHDYHHPLDEKVIVPTSMMRSAATDVTMDASELAAVVEVAEQEEQEVTNDTTATTTKSETDPSAITKTTTMPRPTSFLRLWLGREKEDHPSIRTMVQGERCN